MGRFVLDVSWVGSSSMSRGSVRLRFPVEGWFVLDFSRVGLSSSVGGGVDGLGLVVDHGDVPVSLVQFGVVAGTNEGQI